MLVGWIVASYFHIEGTQEGKSHTIRLGLPSIVQYKQKLDVLSTEHSSTFKMHAIKRTFAVAIAFVRNFENSTRTALTAEDVFRQQKWHTQALEADADRRMDDDSNDNSSGEEEEEEEADGGVAYIGQIPDNLQIEELIKAIQYCHNT